MLNDTAPELASPLVQSGLADGIAVITLNDPARRNSVTAELSLALESACREVAAEPEARAVVVTAAGPALSAGGDVGTLTNRAVPLRILYRGLDALAALTVPTLAAVNRPAVGAGLNFALACDVIIAAESARFDPRFLDVGLHPGGGHLWRLQARVGRRAAAALVLFGEALTGRDAVARGLAWACVPDSELLDTARVLAQHAARRSGELVRRTKGQAECLGGKSPTCATPAISNRPPRNGRCPSPPSGRMLRGFSAASPSDGRITNHGRAGTGARVTRVM